jgi:hypothetical protein
MCKFLTLMLNVVNIRTSMITNMNNMKLFKKYNHIAPLLLALYLNDCVMTQISSVNNSLDCTYKKSDKNEEKMFYLDATTDESSLTASIKMLSKIKLLDTAKR